MKVLRAITLLMAACVAQPSALHAEGYFKSGNQLLSDCEDKDVSIACTAYIIGVIDSDASINGNGKDGRVIVCLPRSGFTAGQAQRVAVKYMKDNPEKLHLPAPLILIFAYMEAFPCPKAGG